MQLKQLEVSLSKEERRIVDEFGNTASTWAKIGFTVELAEGDDPGQSIRALRELIQPEVDDWLLRQGGYVAPPPEEMPELTEETGDFPAEVTDDIFDIPE